MDSKQKLELIIELLKLEDRAPSREYTIGYLTVPTFQGEDRDYLKDKAIYIIKNG